MNNLDLENWRSVQGLWVDIVTHFNKRKKADEVYKGELECLNDITLRMGELINIMRGSN